MIDTKANPARYIKLMALVIVLGLISAVVTFAFMVLVHQGIHVVWEQAASALGMEPSSLIAGTISWAVMVPVAMAYAQWHGKTA